MLLDYNSMLLAIGFAGAGLAVTLFGSWLSARADRFLLTWAIGVGLIVAHVFAYSRYIEAPAPLLQIAAFALLLAGFAVLMRAALEFRSRNAPVAVTAAVAATPVAATVVAAAFGLDGVVSIVANTAAMGILLATARQYWQARAEAPIPITVIAILYAVMAVSFGLCAGVLLFSGQFVIGKAPDNWAEDLNVIICIAGVTGIGALSLALNQSRLARSHRQDALTDPLTGLMNRRALFTNVGAEPIDRFTGVLLFDLDHFKLVNDRYGHATGDEVLRRFALVMRQCLRTTDIAARLGGEEFAAILPRSTAERAHQVAERVRKSLADLVVETDLGDMQCTVSVGIAFPTGEGRTFEQVLGDADKALYRAKNGGRNRVATASLRLAG